jgi:hypothetical protein
MPDPAGLWDDFKVTVSLGEDDTEVLGNVFVHYFVDKQRTDLAAPLLPRASALFKKIMTAWEQQIVAHRASALGNQDRA